MQNKVFETTRHPFGVSAYNPGNPITDFVGRKEELHRFKEYIQIIIEQKNSLAIKLVGPAGVGKSTLFNFLKQVIERERTNSLVMPEYINENTDILSTYFRLPGNVTSFRHLWKGMLNGLYGVIAAETEWEIGFPEYVSLKLIYRFFELEKSKIGDIIWANQNPPKELRYIRFEDIIEPVLTNATHIVPQIQQYYENNKISLRRELLFEINGSKFEITRRDNRKLTRLFEVLDENNPYLERINIGDVQLFRNDDDLIGFLNDLLRFYCCATKTQPVLLIGIDEVAKYTSFEGHSRQEYYRNLGNLFIQLRDQLKQVLLVLISTTEDWADFDHTVTDLTDLSGQLQPILKEMQLNQLSIEDSIDVFKKRIQAFWDNYEVARSSSYPYYPFSEEFFRYVFRYNHRDLRSSIDFLNKLWIFFRHTKQIPWFTSSFQIINFVRMFDKNPIDGKNIESFEWELIESYFEHSPLLKSNTARSSAIEKGLEMAWLCLQQETMSPISKVMNNVSVKTESGKRRPDVVVEVNGNLGRDYLRRVEFQVKAYISGHNVQKEHILSSIELFTMHYTDMLYFIITGDGLDSNAQFAVSQLTKEYPNRILNPALNKEQKRMLILLSLYEQIIGWQIGERLDYDLQVVKYALSTILNEPVSSFLERLSELSGRQILESPELELEDPEKPLDTFFASTSNTQAKQIISANPSIHHIPESVPIADWRNTYGYMEEMKYEACALGEYLQTRENHKRYKNQFTITTVNSKMIQNDNLLEKDRFVALVEEMENRELIEKSKSSYKLTESGIDWYKAIKASNFSVG